MTFISDIAGLSLSWNLVHKYILPQRKLIAKSCIKVYLLPFLTNACAYNLELNPETK